jgi:phospholipid-binding lipoprotein MlaA
MVCLVGLGLMLHAGAATAEPEKGAAQDLSTDTSSAQDEMGISPGDFEDETASSEENDPFEGINRVTSEFNRYVREYVLDPLVDGYKAVTPEEVQKGVSNVASNLTEPLTAGSSLLQGDFENMQRATDRFLVNSTMGLGGINDLAADEGVEQRREDLGQAAGAHGVPTGPHIVLPLIGPSNLRDATGDVLEALVSPMPLAGAIAGSGVNYADKKEDINALSKNAIDPYIAEREAFEKNREYQVHNGEVPMPDMAGAMEEEAK